MQSLTQNSPFETSDKGNQRQKLHYCFYMLTRFGHLAEELCLLKNIFSEKDYELVVMVAPFSSRPPANREVFDLVTRGLTVVEVQDETALYETYQDACKLGAVVNADNTLWACFSGENLKKAFLTAVKRNRIPEIVKLSPEDLDRGMVMRKDFGIPDAARIVTLHVREPGYLPQYPYHSFRDADIDNYRKTVSFLIEQGYYVVRLGDKTMKPLGDLGDQVIDLPFHSAYNEFADPYFIGVSELLVGMPSGPYHLARAMAIPTLTTNAPICITDWGNPQDMYLPKTLYSRSLNRELTYLEILLSPAVSFTVAESFDKAELELRQNTSDEILAATREMLERLKPNFRATPEQAKMDSRVRELQEVCHTVRASKAMQPPFNALFWSGMSLSQEYIRQHPGYLGHLW